MGGASRLGRGIIQPGILPIGGGADRSRPRLGGVFSMSGNGESAGRPPARPPVENFFGSARPPAPQAQQAQQAQPGMADNMNSSMRAGALAL